MAAFTRRAFLQSSGLGLLAFKVAGCNVELTPQEAKQRGAALNVLSNEQAEQLERFGEVLLPGSGAKGLAHYVDHQLAAPPAEQFLMIKYLNVEPPFAPFYQGGLAALDSAARSAHAAGFSALEPGDRQELVRQMAGGNPAGWEGGPPAPFFFFVVRNDALDVTYGTTAGFEELGVPYRAHIPPTSPWGA